MAIFAIPLYGFATKDTSTEGEGYYCDTAYLGSGASGSDTITINFDSYTMTELFLERRCPKYDNVTLSNACVPMAGTIIVGYYDYEFEDLIPNYVAGYWYNNIFYYRPENVHVNSVKDSLYSLMGTNTINPGTSVSQFRNGFTSFVQSKQRTVSYHSVGSPLDINTAINYFNLEIPIIVFLNSYDYYTSGGIAMYDNYMTMNRYYSSNGHAVVAFGYREYNFYNSGNLFRTDRYLIVSFGDGTMGLIPVNTLDKIDNCLAVDIN